MTGEGRVEQANTFHSFNQRSGSTSGGSSEMTGTSLDVGSIGEGSGSVGTSGANGKGKIKPGSEVRIYGRGMSLVSPLHFTFLKLRESARV